MILPLPPVVVILVEIGVPAVALNAIKLVGKVTIKGRTKSIVQERKGTSPSIKSTTKVVPS